jgi:hypothetical protein
MERRGKIIRATDLGKRIIVRWTGDQRTYGNRLRNLGGCRILLRGELKLHHFTLNLKPKYLEVKDPNRVAAGK